MAKEKKMVSDEPIEEAVVKTHPDFVARSLKAINSMEKPAKAQRLANRLLRKARNN